MDLAYYYNERAQLIGHDAADVNAWIAKHPEYQGYLWMNWGDGGDDVDVTDIFYPEPDEDEATDTRRQMVRGYVRAA